MARVSDARGPTTGINQLETAPIPLVISHRSRQHQDETTPIPLEFQVVSRRSRQSQDETTPILLEFEVVQPEPEPVAHVREARAEALPRFERRNIEAAPELREYLARIAAGEVLPPYRGRILANGEATKAVREAPPLARGAAASSGTAMVKLVLGLLLLSALPVASAVLGDDAELQAVGQTISRWFTSGDSPVQTSAPTPQR